jgi:hypothetical protein
MAKLRKQVSLDFINYTKHTINDLLQTKMPQSSKAKLCIMMEKLLQDTKEYAGFRYLYWAKYGKLDWDEAKTKKVYDFIPKEFILGPDYNGDSEFVSDIQGEYSRFYF